MTVLAIDTSMQACSAALSIDGRCIGRFEERERGHAEAIVPMIADVMKDAGVGFDDLDKLAVSTGPGTFTGVRVGIATARGLALAAGLPLIGRSGLVVMAHQVISARSKNEASDILIAADARRGQIYWALFDHTGRERTEPAANTVSEIVSALPQGEIIIAGTGTQLVLETAENMARDVIVTIPDLLPDAAALAKMADGLQPDDSPVTPLYLRRPDAKPQASKVLPWRK